MENALPPLTSVYSKNPLRAGEARPAAFLDRDGVINWDDSYVGTKERFEFVPDIIPFLKDLHDRGYLLVVITNQAGPGKEKFSEEDYYALRKHMHDELQKGGVTIDMELACFAHSEAKVEKYKHADHSWRKPNPGMIEYAAKTLNIDLERSFLIGDKESDVVAGVRGGVGLNVFFSAGFNRKDVKDVPSYEEASAIAKRDDMRGRVVVAENFEEVLKQPLFTLHDA